ncbi:dUTP diphosphatase [Thermosulfuriphilus sp.]
MKEILIPIEVLPHAKDLPLPQYMTSGASGLDLLAAISEPVTVTPGQIVLLPTGIRMAIPEGFEGQVRPRSGLAIKFGLTVVNSPGTIDSDYRGEIKVGLINLGQQKVVIKRGERIAQLVISPVARARLVSVSNLDPTDRGPGGFGHTGR